MIKLGIAPIGWTNDDMPELGGHITYEQCISEMALAGYQGCEAGKKFPTDNMDYLKKTLELRGLKLCNQWFSYELTSRPFHEVKKDFINHIKFLNFFDAKVVGGAECANSIHGQYYTPLSNRRPESTEKWKKLTHGLDQLGKISKEDYGIALSYHHHLGTMVETQEEVDILLNETDDRYVTLNYDCGHFSATDENPTLCLQKYISRISHIHVKDMRKAVKDRIEKDNLSFMMGVKLGLFTVPGNGDLDMDSIIEIINKSDYEGWVVVEAEQDPSIADPFEYAKKGYDFLKKKIKK